MSEQNPDQTPISASEPIQKSGDETFVHMSWTAVRFISAPPIRIFQWTVIAIIAVLAATFIFAKFTEMDIAVGAEGEIVSNKGLRHAIPPSEGLVTRIVKGQGDRVEKGEIIAVMSMGSVSPDDILEIRESLSELVRSVEAGEEAAEAPTAFLAMNRFSDPIVLQTLTSVESAYKTHQEAKAYLESGLKNELRGTFNRIRTLSQKLEQMKKSSKRSLMAMYIESSEDELGKLQAQVATDTNRATTRKEAAEADLIKSSRIAIGALNDYVGKHEVRSPAAGSIAKLHIGPNTYVSPAIPVATVIPEGAEFVSILNVDSKDIADVRLGQKVLFKLEAYPYQRYGVFEGKVISFDEIRDGMEDEAVNRKLAGLEEAAVQFQVRASIAPPPNLAPELQKKLKLLSGMKLSGSILTDRRPVADVIFERIFGP